MAEKKQKEATPKEIRNRVKERVQKAKAAGIPARMPPRHDSSGKWQPWPTNIPALPDSNPPPPMNRTAPRKGSPPWRYVSLYVPSPSCSALR